MHDPANELYDAACETLLAAQRLRDAASRPGVQEAVPATVGALEEALAALDDAVERLRERAGAAPRPRAPRRTAAGTARARRAAPSRSRGSAA